MTEFGGPEALEVHRVAQVDPAPSDVVVAVRAAAVNPTDTGLRSGKYGDFDWDPPYVPGMDAAGRVVAIGADVDGLSIGDEVMAAVAPARPAGGAYTDLLTVPAAQVIAIPDGASVEEAATLPMNGITAKIALDALDLAEGETFAVLGAAGQLGSLAIPLAKNRGLRVVADAAPEDADLVRSFGADEVVARGDDVGAAVQSATDGGADGVLNASLQDDQALAAVRAGGGIAAVRAFDATPGDDVEVHRISVFDHLDDRAALEELRTLADSGDIQLRVAGTHAPEEAAEAHRRLAEGGVRGRLLILF
ncbi:NADP-dependent oxidoreductase [Nitriliruptoria bacterium AS10]|nr:NADP-dependent oxidoreductase [Salsipaludibacter albus]